MYHFNYVRLNKNQNNRMPLKQNKTLNAETSLQNNKD